MKKIDQFFNKIYIIESLGSVERHTGLELYNDLLRWKDNEIKEFSAEYVVVKNKADFFSILNFATIQVSSDNIFPIFHIETHGNRNGLVLLNGDMIYWEELRTHLTKINIETKLNLDVATF